MVSEFEHSKRVVQAAQIKHEREGILRRNKVLLEHILMDRMGKDADTRNYFKGEINVEERFKPTRTREKAFEHKAMFEGHSRGYIRSSSVMDREETLKMQAQV